MTNSDLASDLLEHGTCLLEEAQRSTGHVNLMAARALGDASLLLGEASCAERCERFLQESPPRSFWQGVISNIPHNHDSVPETFRSLTPVEQIRKKHPQFTANYASSVMTKEMGDHIEPCQSRDYDAAYANAGSEESQWHEVVLAQALNGDMHFAAPKLHDIRSATIRAHVQLVFAIESYRRGDSNTGREMHDLLELKGIGEYTASHMALGITGYVPWPFYPFADY